MGEFGRIQQQQLATTKNTKKLTTQLRTKDTPIPPISQTRRIPSTVPAAPRKIPNPQMPKKPTRTKQQQPDCLPAGRGVVCFPSTCKNSTSSNPRTPCDYFTKIPLCSHTSLPLGCCCCIHHEKQTHPSTHPLTHIPESLAFKKSKTSTTMCAEQETPMS